MTICLNTIHQPDIKKKWMKAEAFYTMLYDIARGGLYQSEYFCKQYDIIVQLCDLMLQNASPKCKDETEKRYNMGGSNQANAKFAPLVSLVSHIVQCMSMESMDDDTHTYLTFVSSTNPTGPRVRVT
jgi:hypothetical protein